MLASLQSLFYRDVNKAVCLKAKAKARNHKTFKANANAKVTPNSNYAVLLSVCWCEWTHKCNSNRYQC